MISPKSYNSLHKKEGKDINSINNLQYVEIQTMKKKKKEKFILFVKKVSMRKSKKIMRKKNSINARSNRK